MSRRQSDACGGNADGTQEHVVRERAFKDGEIPQVHDHVQSLTLRSCLHTMPANTCCAVYIESCLKLLFFQSAPSITVITKKCS